VKAEVDLYFTDVFGVSEKALDKYGAFNISLFTDLPLFIDPFLLFNSKRNVYRRLHNDIIRYLRFLRDKSADGLPDPALLRAWYYFSEVRQTWLGFCESGNRGRGLGHDFAIALDKNLRHVFSGFGGERVTRGSHLEKLCLISEGVGRDTISDFTTNLIKSFLLEYTEAFARKYIARSLRKRASVPKVTFNYVTESWQPASFELPRFRGRYVILTPKDILTKDDTWINKEDLFRHFDEIPDAIGNAELRAQINNYFLSVLPKEPKAKDRREAIAKVVFRYPKVIDYFIKFKEERGEQAVKRSSLQVFDSKRLYVQQFGQLVALLSELSAFYRIAGKTSAEALQRIMFLKDVVENKGGYRMFYRNGEPIAREEDVHILYRLTWFATPSDVGREANDGRGPVDFKISRGSGDKTLVEFKLASNPQLKKNLQNQLAVYQKASDAQAGYKVIFYFSEAELAKVLNILKLLGMTDDPHVILIDARKGNKPSGSKA
jgi:hypothetical protein